MGSTDDPDVRSKSCETFFAPPARATTAELQELVRLAEHPLIRVLLESMQGFVMVLDHHRQLLAANAELTDALARQGTGCVVGLRPGELLNCAHFTEGPNGCGTAPHCRSCGAAIALLAAQTRGVPAVGECRLSLSHDGKLRAREFRVRASPLQLGAHALLVLVLEDISAAKRRDVLERVFLHDLLNTVGGIEGWSSLLGEEDARVAAAAIVTLSNQLKGEIDFHRLLVQAESDALAPQLHATTADRLLVELETLFHEHRAAVGKRLEVQRPAADVALCTDRNLLVRVLVNMVKNALEATAADGTVRVAFTLGAEGRPTFSVHNRALIAPDVASHIFERSFSTKEAVGRGLGTYSMKLFGESYLRGKVDFRSTAEDGTTFSITLPLESRRDAQDPAPAPAVEAVAPTRPTLPLHERVLYVDDHPALLRLGRRLLERHGYEVTACSGGLSALECFRANPAGFDLVITDVAMPDLDGLSLARAIHAARPELPIIVTTGLLDTPDEDELRAHGIRAFLHKPMSMEDTLEVVARVLANPD
jgi:CheY-like chemotaxis protein